MSQTVKLMLEEDLQRSVLNGNHNFIGHLIAVLEDGGYNLSLGLSGETSSGTDRVITHMSPPPKGGLTFRRVYHYPFWAIESTSERWHWDVARSPFPPETETQDTAQTLYTRWQDRLFPDLARSAKRDGFVYVPLQGQLLKHRGFQRCAPLEMLYLTLQADPQRDIIAALHPNETYSPAELDSLNALAEEHPRLTIRKGGMDQLLHGCDYVVTMNSAAAFNGFFFGKPCILFAEIDFHHIALTAGPDNLTAFDRVMDHQPDYARYIAWFWQENCINAGRPDVRDRIRDALIRGGWPMPG